MKRPEIHPRLDKFLEPHILPMYIDGTWVEGSSNAVIQVINPADETVVGRVYQADETLVRQAVQAAQRAFSYHSPWRKITPRRRETILLKLADLIEKESEAIAQLVTLENGKLYGQALSSDALGAAATFRYYAGWTTKIEGQSLDLSIAHKDASQNFAFTLRQPVGVVAAIVPWNFPFSIAAWKVAPALAAGCTVVLKPSEETPLSALLLAQLAEEAGVPAGVFNVLTGNGATTGRLLTQSPGVDKITFTGSTDTGRQIGKAAMENITDVSLELGGKSPVIVFDDISDWPSAVAGVANGIFRNQGQVCVAGSRLYVQEGIYDRFLSELSTFAGHYKLGDGFNPDMDMGPLVSSGHLERVESYINRGINSGARCICGGQRIGGKGYFLPPTILAVPDNSIEIVREEVFGPVLTVLPFSDREEAIALANDNSMGLAATVWTDNLQNAITVVKRIDAGIVFVNSPVRSDPNLPLGGFKSSGIGRELGKTGIYNYTTIKSANIVF